MLSALVAIFVIIIFALIMWKYVVKRLLDKYVPLTPEEKRQDLMDKIEALKVWESELKEKSEEVVVGRQLEQVKTQLESKQRELAEINRKLGI